MRSSATVDVDVEERVCLGDGDGDAHVMSDAPLDAFQRSLSGMMMMTVSSIRSLRIYLSMIRHSSELITVKKTFRGLLKNFSQIGFDIRKT